MHYIQAGSNIALGSYSFKSNRLMKGPDVPQ